MKPGSGKMKFQFANQLLLSLLVPSCSSRGQLIGSRGVFGLPEGQEYRDATTLEASRSVIRPISKYLATKQAESGQQISKKG